MYQPMCFEVFFNSNKCSLVNSWSNYFYMHASLLEKKVINEAYYNEMK